MYLAQEGDAGLAVKVMEEVGDQNDVIAFTKRSVEGATGNEVMAGTHSGLVRVVGGDLENLRPVESINVRVRIVACDGDAVETVAGGDVEDLASRSFFDECGREILGGHAHHGHHVAREEHPDGIVRLKGVVDCATTTAHSLGDVSVCSAMMIAGEEVGNAADIGGRVAIEKEGAVLLESVAAIGVREEAFDREVVAEDAHAAFTGADTSGDRCSIRGAFSDGREDAKDQSGLHGFSELKGVDGVENALR